MNTTINPQIELAFDYICHTNKHIFLTGKAGTGKTTFLHRVCREVPKRKAVVAPTGVAAMNAKGMTIHSLFQLPFGPIVPGQASDDLKRRGFTRQKIDLLRSLDLLIIDEISMVRADVLDAIDAVLKRFRGHRKPFGGVQLLMIGDLHQLPPVVREEDWALLRPHYETAYFFGSNALRESGAITIELKHIYRQSDQHFIDLLNKVRSNQMDDEVLNRLNSQYEPDFEPMENEGFITLTSHNAAAQTINQQKLKALHEKKHTFKAIVDGDFPAHTFPTDESLEFKIGAQVMFVRNDIQAEKRYYNGKIGQITDINNDSITVQCPGDELPINVQAVEWNNYKYLLNEVTKQVEETVVGTFTQHPLKLAWAITIHKSQGLTFDKVIIDAQAAFAHGQVYVALSRCRSFEGIVLISKLVSSSVKTDVVVKDYTDSAQENQPTAAQLEAAKHQFQQDCIRELFDFRPIQHHLDRLARAVLEHEHSLQQSIREDFAHLESLINQKGIALAQRFQPQLAQYFTAEELPEANELLQARIKKACLYFTQQLQSQFLPTLEKFEFITDNKAVRKVMEERTKTLHQDLFIKKACFEASMEGFDTGQYGRTKANAHLDFVKKSKSAKVKNILVPQKITHPELYKMLVHWRKEQAEELGTELYQILPTKTITDIVRVLPTIPKNLLLIKGIGKSRAKQFGPDILQMVQSFVANKDLQTDILDFTFIKKEKQPKPPKPDTKKLTYELYQEGKNIDEIAAIRGLATSTIETHLAHFVENGTVLIGKLVSLDKIEAISAFFDENGVEKLSPAKEYFGNNYSWGELRLVQAFCRKENQVFEEE